MHRIAMLLLLVLPLQPATSRFDRLPVQQKIDFIEQGKIPPGTQLNFGERDLNTFLAKKAKEVVGDGMRDPRIEINSGYATGYAFVDFIKVQKAQGQEMGRLLSWLLDGEHPVTVSGRVVSANGVARVDLDRVDISGHSVRGRALEVLIKTFLLPHYPSAKVGEDFELGYNVDRIELKQGTASVFMASKKTGK